MHHNFCRGIVLSVAAYATVCGTAMAKDAETLAVGALEDWDIVISDEAIASEVYAAEELRKLLGPITGGPLPVVRKTNRPDRHLLVGRSEALRSSSIGVRPGGSGPEDLWIVVRPDNIAISGGRPRGTLYGVYEFLERYLGVRFLTYDHTYVPPNAGSRTIPCETHTVLPPFSFRWSYYRENAAHPAFAARLRVNTVTHDEKLGGVTPQSLINHSLYRLLPVGKYGKTHPEYFALVDGKRKLEAGGGGPELCVTNPDVVQIVADAVIGELDKDPSRQNISVSQNDNAAYCRCPQCEAINKREGTPMGAHLAFVNAVAERVEKKYPNVKIGTLAYWYTRKCPKTIKPRRNVQIQLCSIECCTLHAIDDPKCSRNRQFCHDLKAWKEVCDDIWIWNYNTNFSRYDLPFPNLRSIGKNVLFFHQNHVKGVFMQANGNGLAGEMSDLRNFVIARCLWHPGLDSWKLTKEFCRLHYQKAAGPVFAYLTMLHDNAEQSGVHPGCFPKPAEVGLRPEICRQALALFDQALAAADDKVVRQRVEKASITAWRATIDVLGQMRYVDGRCRLVFPEEYGDVVGRYADLCQRYGMTMAAEGTPIADYLARVRKARSGRPACQLENNVWRLTVLPEDNAKVVELVHKPSGRDLLFGLDSWSLDRGTLRELGMKGCVDDKSAAYEVERDKGSTVLTRRLPDGSTIVRRFGFSGEDPGKILFETTVTHHGPAAKTYQFRIEPELATQTTSGDSKVLAALVKRDRWVQFNSQWREDTGPDAKLLEGAAGGGLALWNAAAKFGLRIGYDPAEFTAARFHWRPDRAQANLELVTAEAELQPGQSLSYAYQIDYLAKPPAL